MNEIILNSNTRDGLCQRWRKRAGCVLPRRCALGQHRWG